MLSFQQHDTSHIIIDKNLDRRELEKLRKITKSLRKNRPGDFHSPLRDTFIRNDGSQISQAHSNPLPLRSRPLEPHWDYDLPQKPRSLNDLDLIHPRESKSSRIPHSPQGHGHSRQRHHSHSPRATSLPRLPSPEFNHPEYRQRYLDSPKYSHSQRDHHPQRHRSSSRRQHQHVSFASGSSSPSSPSTTSSSVPYIRSTHRRHYPNYHRPPTPHHRTTHDIEDDSSDSDDSSIKSYERKKFHTGGEKKHTSRPARKSSRRRHGDTHVRRRNFRNDSDDSSPTISTTTTTPTSDHPDSDSTIRPSSYTTTTTTIRPKSRRGNKRSSHPAPLRKAKSDDSMQELFRRGGRKGKGMGRNVGRREVVYVRA